VTLNISPEKIGDLIGPKGKTIRGIQDETGAELSVDDSGLVTIAAVGGESMERARQMVMALTAEPIVGEVYEGTVKSTMQFGAFIEIMPGTEALLHISELRHGRTEKTEDVVKKGDRVKVKLIERDERGRLRLSMKALQPKPEGGTEDGGDRGRSGGGGGGGGSDRGERSPRESNRAEGDIEAGSPAMAAESAERGGGADGGERGASDRPRRPRGGGGGRGGRGGSSRSGS
jgi:polyribonucleotide nucleotidyltransferase